MSKDTIVRLITIFEDLKKISKLSDEGERHLTQLRQELKDLEDESDNKRDK